MVCNLIKTLHLKVLWFRKTYPFLWAHKPLCKKYREDVIHIKGIYLCRSCFMVYLGMVLGTLFLFITWYYICRLDLAGDVETPICAMLTTLAFIVVPFSSPSLYKKMPRKIRDMLRFFLGFLIPSFCAVLLFEKFFFAFLFLVTLYLFLSIYSRKRVKRKLRDCFECAEYSEEHHICSGYTLQSELIRKYEEEATEYLLRCGYVPSCLKNEAE